MKLVTDRPEVLRVLDRCRQARCALFSPNGELAAEVEGLLLGAQQFAEEGNIDSDAARTPVSRNSKTTNSATNASVAASIA